MLAGTIYRHVLLSTSDKNTQSHPFCCRSAGSELVYLYRGLANLPSHFVALYAYLVGDVGGVVHRTNILHTYLPAEVVQEVADGGVRVETVVPDHRRAFPAQRVTPVHVVLELHQQLQFVRAG